jgi:hypothetical protein
MGEKNDIWPNLIIVTNPISQRVNSTILKRFNRLVAAGQRGGEKNSF